MKKKVGDVIQYFAAGRVAEVKLTGTLRVGDLVHIVDRTTNFKQLVRFMYIGQDPVDKARSGQIIWLGVIKRVHKDDKVFVISEELEKPRPDEPEPEPPPKPPVQKPRPDDKVEGEGNDDDEDEDDEPDLPDWDDFWKHRKRTDGDKGGGAGG